MMKLKLKPLGDQVIVITGASSGIGLSTARQAAQAGASVVLSARNQRDLARAVGEIRAAGGRAIDVGAALHPMPAAFVLGFMGAMAVGLSTLNGRLRGDAQPRQR
jgi:NAD(P)-dependent dehydrogenase (short-subunit alcohol dehydrogenase family)